MQDIEIDNVKYYWTRTYSDPDNAPRFVNVFITVQSSTQTLNKEET